MVKNVPIKQIMTIPDNSGSQNGDICRNSMWGIYRGFGEVHRFYCSFCCMIITVNFPRWSRISNKMLDAEDVIINHWACPGCCKSSPILMHMKEEDWGWDMIREE